MLTIFWLENMKGKDNLEDLGIRKSKGKVIHVLFLTEHKAMKAYWGSGCIASRILALGIRRR